MGAIQSIFKIPELKKRIIFTVGLLFVFRIGAHIPTPGINGEALSQLFSQAQGTLLGLMDLFSGGSFRRLTIFALGIMPYISASIIFQLLTVVIPQLEKLSKEGEAGRRKINQYTRYATVLLSTIQSFGISFWLENLHRSFGLSSSIVLDPGWHFRLITVITLTSGTIFIMWLGEQISQRGIGNGISLIITAGIISRFPSALHNLGILFTAGQIRLFKLLFLAVMFVGVIMAVIILSQGQRNIPVQYARRIVGRKMYGGQSTYIPLRVNHSGVIPVIFASSIMMMPATMAQFARVGWMQKAAEYLNQGGWIYLLVNGALIIFFCFFYTAMTFNSNDVSDNMKKYGGFVPGIRPGRPTAEFFDHIMARITLIGAVYLVAVAEFPTLISTGLKIPSLVASFLGGTGLLIVVGVTLDTIRQIESHLMMRHYEGFIKKGKIKGRY